MADRDHVISAVGQFFVNDALPSSCLLRFFENVTEWNLFSVQKSSSLQEMIGHTHSCLGSAQHRIEGLLLLEKLIRQSNTQTFSRNVKAWIGLLLQILQSHCPTVHYQLTCHVISVLLGESKCFSELHVHVGRELSTSFIPQLVPILLAAPVQWSREATLCLNSCLRNYPGPCGPFKGKIENFIHTLLDQDYPPKEAVLCYSLVAGCGGSGNLSIKHVEGWSRQCNKLTSALWETLAQLYDGLDQDLPLRERSSLPLSHIPDVEPLRSSRLESRYDMLCQCLSSLLREEFSAPAQVPLEEIMTLIQQTLAVNNKMLLSRPTTSRLTLAYVLPRVHQSSLHLLSALILCAKKVLVPYASTVCGLLTQTLSWTTSHQGSDGQEKQYSSLRETVYSVTCDWLKTLGACSGLAAQGSEFITAILTDIKIQADELRIEGSKPRDNEGLASSKKRKKGSGYQELSQGQGLAKKVNKTANQKTCSSALEALRWVLITDGVSLKTKTMREVVSCVMAQCLSVQQSGRGSLPAPYFQPVCRARLYRVVQALVLVSHQTCPAPVHVATKVLQVGLLDTDTEVCGCCREGLAVLEAIIHPRAPCLKPVLKISDVPILLSTNGQLCTLETTHLQGSVSVRSRGDNQNVFPCASEKSLSGFSSAELISDKTDIPGRKSRTKDDIGRLSSPISDDEVTEEIIGPSKAKQARISPSSCGKGDNPTVDTVGHCLQQSREKTLCESDAEIRIDFAAAERMSDEEMDSEEVAIAASTKDLPSKGGNAQQTLKEGGNSVDLPQEDIESPVDTSTSVADVTASTSTAEDTFPESQNAELEEMLSSFVDASPDSGQG